MRTAVEALVALTIILQGFDTLWEWAEKIYKVII